MDGDLGLLGWGIEIEGAKSFNAIADMVEMVQKMGKAGTKTSKTLFDMAKKHSVYELSEEEEKAREKKQKSIKQIIDLVRDMGRGAKKAGDLGTQAFSSMLGLTQKLVGGLGRAVGQVENLASKAEGLLDKLGDLNFDLSTSMEQDWTNARAEMAKASLGMAEDGEKALGKLFAYSKASGTDLNSLIKGWKMAGQTSKEVMEGFGATREEQAKTLAAFEAMDISPDEILKAQTLLQKRLGMSTERAMDLQGAIFSMAKAHNMGTEALQAFAPTVEDVVKQFEAANIALTPEAAEKATMSVMQLGVALQKAGAAKPEEAFGKATEVFGKMMEETGQVRKMFLGMGGSVSDMAKQFGMSAGSIEPFWQLMQGGPAEAAKGLLGMMGALKGQREQLVKMGQQGTPAFQAIEFQMANFSEMVGELSPEMRTLVNTNKDLFFDVLAKAPEIAQGAGKAMVGMVKDAHKSTVSFSEAWEMTVNRLKDAQKMLGRGIAKEALGAVREGISQYKKSLDSLKNSDSVLATAAKYLSAYSQVGLYAFVPALDKMGIMSKGSAAQVVAGIQAMHGPLKSLDEIGLSLPKVLGGIGSVLTGPLGLVALVAGIGTFVGAASGAFGEGPKKWADKLKDGLIDLVFDVELWFKTELPKLFAKVKDWFTKEGPAIGDTIRDMGAGIVEFLKGMDWGAMFSWVLDMTTELTADLLTLAGDLALWLGDKVMEGFDYLSDKLANMDWSPVFTALGELFSKMWDLWKKMMFEWVPKVVIGGLKIGWALMKGIGKAVSESDWGGWIVEGLAGSMGWVGAWLSDKWDLIKKMFDPTLMVGLDKQQRQNQMMQIAALMAGEGPAMQAFKKQNEARRKAEEQKRVDDIAAKIKEEEEAQKQSSERQAKMEGVIAEKRAAAVDRAKKRQEDRAKAKAKRPAETKAAARAADPATTENTKATTELTTVQRVGNDIALKTNQALGELVAALKGGRGGGALGGRGGGRGVAPVAAVVD